MARGVARVSLVLTVTVAGMAIGGWISGALDDLTGSHRAAFLNGIAWNLLNMSIAFWLPSAAGARGRPRLKWLRLTGVLFWPGWRIAHRKPNQRGHNSL